MSIRHVAAGLLAAAALAAFPATADASSLPEPSRGTPVETASTIRDTLMNELLAEYSVSHRRSVHNEIVLVRNVPASAVL